MLRLTVVASTQAAKPEFSQVTAAPVLQPKTGKPRPHVCCMCHQSFARLEHLKRHKKIHTKEKPFGCPQCTRRFARHDMLQRHQQKLHQYDVIPSMPRNGRQQSTSSLLPNATGRMQKNTLANSINGTADAGTASMRQPANAIVHIDPSALDHPLTSHDASLAIGTKDHAGHSYHASLSGLDSSTTFHYRAMSDSIDNHRRHHRLPELDTHLGLGLYDEMRTAHIRGCGPNGFELEKFFGSSGSTITSNQLHHLNTNIVNTQSPFRGSFTNPFVDITSIEESDSGWSVALEDYATSCRAEETGVNGFSPLAVGVVSRGGSNKVTMDGSGQSTMWLNPLVAHPNDTFSLNPLEQSPSYTTGDYPYNECTYNCSV